MRVLAVRGADREALDEALEQANARLHWCVMRRWWRNVLNAASTRWRQFPPGTAVDPAEFPEQQYPVQCLQCGYALRGVADGNCPECGRPFTRGHLLVEQYARGRRPRTDRRRRASRLLLALSMFAALPAPLLIVLGLELWRRSAPALFLDLLRKGILDAALRAVFVVMISSPIPAFAAAIIEWKISPPSIKRKRVLEAARRR